MYEGINLKDLCVRNKIAVTFFLCLALYILYMTFTLPLLTIFFSFFFYKDCIYFFNDNSTSQLAFHFSISV